MQDLMNDTNINHVLDIYGEAYTATYNSYLEYASGKSPSFNNNPTTDVEIVFFREFKRVTKYIYQYLFLLPSDIQFTYGDYTIHGKISRNLLIGYGDSYIDYRVLPYAHSEPSTFLRNTSILNIFIQEKYEWDYIDGNETIIQKLIKIGGHRARSEFKEILNEEYKKVDSDVNNDNKRLKMIVDLINELIITTYNNTTRHFSADTSLYHDPKKSYVLEKQLPEGINVEDLKIGLTEDEWRAMGTFIDNYVPEDPHKLINSPFITRTNSDFNGIDIIDDGLTHDGIDKHQESLEYIYSYSNNEDELEVIKATEDASAQTLKMFKTVKDKKAIPDIFPQNVDINSLYGKFLKKLRSVDLNDITPPDNVYDWSDLSIFSADNTNIRSDELFKLLRSDTIFTERYNEVLYKLHDKIILETPLESVRLVVAKVFQYLSELDILPTPDEFNEYAEFLNNVGIFDALELNGDSDDGEISKKITDLEYFAQFIRLCLLSKRAALSSQDRGWTNDWRTVSSLEKALERMLDIQKIDNKGNQVDKGVAKAILINFLTRRNMGILSTRTSTIYPKTLYMDAPYIEMKRSYNISDSSVYSLNFDGGVPAYPSKDLIQQAIRMYDEPDLYKIGLVVNR